MKTNFANLKLLALSALFLAVFFSAFSSALASCTDSDGGNTYDVKGHVTGVTVAGTSYSYWDSCVNSNRLKEYYCLPGGVGYLTTLHDCEYGCSNGACAAAPSSTPTPIVSPNNALRAALSVDKASVAPGETLTVTLSFNCLQSPCNRGGVAFNYPTEAFELVSSSVTPALYTSASPEYEALHQQYSDRFPYNPERTFNGLVVCNEGSLGCWKILEWYDVPSGWNTVVTLRAKTLIQLPRPFPQITQYPVPFRYRAWAVPSPYSTYYGDPLANPLTNCDTWGFWLQSDVLRCNYYSQTMPIVIPTPSPSPSPTPPSILPSPSPSPSPAPNACTDSDGGANLYVQGTMQAPRFLVPAQSVGGGCQFANGGYTCIDYCTPQGLLKEFYCVQNNQYGASHDYDCNAYNASYVCSDRACRPPSVSPSPSPSSAPSPSPSFAPSPSPSPSLIPSPSPSIAPSTTPSTTPARGVYSCSMIPGEAALEGGATQEFRARCESVIEDSIAIVDCPPLSWGTTITGGSMNPVATQSGASRSVFTAPRTNASGTITAFYASVTAPQTAQDKGGETLSFASGINSFSCSANVNVKIGAVVPTPMPPRSCIVHPQSATVPQGGMFNFVASCFSTATPPTAAADIAPARVACPSLCWTTSVAGGTVVNSENTGTLRVAETALAPQSGRITASSDLLQCPQAAAAGAAALAFQGGFSCNAPVSVESACINGWRVETRELAVGNEVNVGEYVFKLEDLSSDGSKAIVYGKNAKPPINAATNWNLCGSRVPCTIPLGGTLSMPPTAAKEDEEALVTFTRFVSARNPATQPTTAANSRAQEIDFATQTTVTPAAASGARAVLTIKARCASTEPSCSITPNPAVKKGPFSQQFTATFKNVFGDTAVAGAKASVSCMESDAAPKQVDLSSSGIATFECAYPAVDKLTYYTVSASFGKAVCKTSVQNQPGGIQAGDISIASPTEGSEYWAKTVSLRFLVNKEGYHKCEYALYDATGGKAYAIEGAVQGRVEKKIEIPVAPSGQWLKVRCRTATSTSDVVAQGAWISSKMVSFKVFEPDRPIVFAPDQNYRHYGLTTPVKAEFRIGGSLNAYSCYYVLDGKAYQIGKVAAGTNAFVVSGKDWTHAQKHYLSVRCASPSGGIITPTSAPTVTAPPSQAEWSCSLSPSSATVASGGKQTFVANCFFKQDAASDAAPSKVECPKSIASALQWRTTVESGKMAPVSGAASSTLTIAQAVVGQNQPSIKGMVYVHYPTSVLTTGVNEFECSANVNAASTTPTPNQQQTAAAASVQTLAFASFTTWPAVQSGEKESPIVAFYTYEDGRPAVLAPEEGKAYGSPIELAFVVGGTSAAYECAAAFDGTDEKSVVVKAGEIAKQVKEFNSGNHKASVKCVATKSTQNNAASRVGAWVSSGEVNFVIVNTNQPVIVSPKNGEIVKDSIDFAFYIDGDYLAYDCKGTLKKLAISTARDAAGTGTGVATAPITVDFGRVTRKSCGTPEKVSKLVKDLAPGKYEAQVLCNSVNTIACKAVAETAGASELEFAGYSSDAVTFEVNPLATPTPTPSASPGASATPTPSVTPSSSPIPSCGNGVCEASLGETVSNCPTDCSTGGGNGGGGRPCTSNSDCGPGSVCVNGVCNGCLCMLDGYCNPCCLAGTDKDCGQTKKAQQTLAGTGTKTPTNDDYEWPPATQPPYAPQYALKLKCVLTEQKKVAATLTADGSPACDANMRLTIGKRTLAPDASKCAQGGVHEFDVSGLAAGEYSAKATSLGGATATCKFVIAAGFAFEPWMWIILVLAIVAIAGGAYYWKQQQDKKKGGGSGGKGKRGARAEAEETTDLLEEE